MIDHTNLERMLVVLLGSFAMVCCTLQGIQYLRPRDPPYLRFGTTGTFSPIRTLHESSSLDPLDPISKTVAVHPWIHCFEKYRRVRYDPMLKGESREPSSKGYKYVQVSDVSDFIRIYVSGSWGEPLYTLESVYQGADVNVPRGMYKLYVHLDIYIYTRTIQDVSNGLPYPTYRSLLGTRWKC